MQFLKHVWFARPTWREVAIFSPIWGAAIALSVMLNHAVFRHMLPPNSLRISVIFALGAVVAAPVALWCARMVSPRNANSAFASTFVFLGVGTIGLTALIFALDFWNYFSQWHGQAFTKLWANQFVFTCASAIYQFLVSGLRLYLPFGLIALVTASIWASKRMMR